MYSEDKMRWNSVVAVTVHGVGARDGMERKGGYLIPSLPPYIKERNYLHKGLKADLVASDGGGCGGDGSVEWTFPLRNQNPKKLGMSVLLFNTETSSKAEADTSEGLELKNPDIRSSWSQPGPSQPGPVGDRFGIFNSRDTQAQRESDERDYCTAHDSKCTAKYLID